MRDADMEALDKWQSTIEGMTERQIYDLGYVVENLTDAAKTREGLKILRRNYDELLAHKRKLDDLEMDLRLLMEWRPVHEGTIHSGA